MMDAGNLMDVNSTDPDSNQEPMVRSVERIESMLNELATAHERIEERIRMLERVTDRARQRGWRPPGELNTAQVSHQSNDERRMIEAIAERGNGIGCKRDSSHLVARALEMESTIKKDDKEGGSFYDCNICLDLAKEPVLTCCGHLFCWACFYQVAEIDSSCKECPVCKGEVSDSTMIPIYGNGGGGDCVSVTESGLMIPPRPKARRVESVRQHVLNHGPPHVPVTEAVRRIIGAVNHQTREQDGAVDHQTEAMTSSGAISLPRAPYFLRRRSIVLRTSDGDGDSRDTHDRGRRRLN